MTALKPAGKLNWFCSPDRQLKIRERAMLRITSVAVLALMGCALTLTAANAHPKLVKSSPAANAAIDDSPKELRLSFNEELVAKFSGVEVKTSRGRRSMSAPAPDSADKKQLVVPVPTPLAEGAYEVEWHAVAADTHRIHGSYSFTVKR
jgi:methionine-rich copper-binding protein CopC